MSNARALDAPLARATGPFRAVTINWSYRPGPPDTSDPVTSALVVPIVEDGRETGTIAAYAPSRGNSAPSTSRRSRRWPRRPGRAGRGARVRSRAARAHRRAHGPPLAGGLRRRARAGRGSRTRDGRAALAPDPRRVTSPPTAPSPRCFGARVAPRAYDAGDRRRMPAQREPVRDRPPRHRRGPGPPALRTPARGRRRRPPSARRASSRSPPVSSSGARTSRARRSTPALSPAVGRTRTEPLAFATAAAAVPMTPTGRAVGQGAFLERLARETDRARHLERPLTLLVVRVDGIRRIAEAHGETAAERVLDEVEVASPRRPRTVVRSAPGSRRTSIAAIHAGSHSARAEQVFSAVQASLESEPAPHLDRLAVSAGISELAAGDDPAILLDRAEHALERAKPRRARHGRGRNGRR